MVSDMLQQFLSKAKLFIKYNLEQVHLIGNRKSRDRHQPISWLIICTNILEKGGEWF